MLCGDAASWGKAASPLSRTVVLWSERIGKVSQRKPYREKTLPVIQTQVMQPEFQHGTLQGVSAMCESVSPL